METLARLGPLWQATPREGVAPMKRREFITGLAGAVAWPVAARAQQMPEVGFLGSGTESSERHLVGAFQDGLAEAGFVVGRNIVIEHRAAEGRYDTLPAT